MSDTYIVPMLIANEGDAAGWRYVEFFTANINTPNTRRACARFFAWCETRGALVSLDLRHEIADRIREVRAQTGMSTNEVITVG